MFLNPSVQRRKKRRSRAATPVAKTKTKDMKKFEDPSAERDAAALADSSLDDQGLYALGHKYDEYALRYFKKRTSLLNSRQNAGELARRKDHLIKIIEMAAAASTTPESFMRAQFEQLAKFVPDIFPAISIIASDKAPKRWSSFMKRMNETFLDAHTQREQYVAAPPPEPDAMFYLRRSVEEVIARMERNLKIIGSLNDVLWIQTLEVAARLGAIKAEYIVTLDERWQQSSTYVAALAAEAKEKYKPAVIESLRKERREMVERLAKDERVKQYA